jgi:hypothetical protein
MVARDSSNATVVAYLNKQVEACDVLLAVIGPNWQSQLDKQDYKDQV